MIANILGNQSHVWRFFRVGGTDQVKLESAQDLINLEKLDQKLWVALSCPTNGLEFDSKTLELIDTDKDGRIRVPEVLAAVKWANGLLKRPESLLKATDSIDLTDIEDSTDSGRQLLASAKQILGNLGKSEAKVITLADTTDTAKIFAQTKFNGDGIVPPSSADEEPTKLAITNIIECLGGEMDRSGTSGVSQPKVNAFFKAAQAFADWWNKAETDSKNVLPLGENTAVAYELFKCVESKIDDYFTRCRLASFDPRSTNPLNRAEAEYATLAPKLLSNSVKEIADFPLSRIEAGRPLSLLEGLNPAWQQVIEKFKTAVVETLIGKGTSTLSEAQWTIIVEAFRPYQTWIASKAGFEVEKLGLARTRDLLSSKVRDKIIKLIETDKALEPEANAISAVDRLIRYHRDLALLLHNFVNFKDFYSGKKKGIFQIGTLYLDGRSCDLCIKVTDPGKHAGVANLARTYLAYCDCTRKGATEKMTIAAAFTGGDSDQLMVGRNGVFYDRKGQDWDATITKIVEHPISIRQAILAPYKRIARMIAEQIEKMAAARDKAVQDEAAAKIAATSKAIDEKKPAAPAAPAGGMSNTVGILAAVGLALGTLGAAVAKVFDTFMELPWYSKPLAILSVFVLISGPSVVIAWLKLRQRNLGPILDANGWAINGRMKINIPFGGALTALAVLPPTALRSLEDPYAEKHGKRNTVLVIAIIGLILGLLEYTGRGVVSGALEALSKMIGK